MPNPPRKSSKTGCTLLLLLLIAAGGGIAWVSLKKRTSSSGVTYETAPAARGHIEAIVTAIGTLHPLHSVEVGAQVSGQITKVHVQPGDKVEKGALLVEIDASVHQATVEAGRAAIQSLRAQVDEEQAQLILADQQLARQQRMAGKGATSEQELQAARAERDATAARQRHHQAAIAEREASLKGDEVLLGYTRIYAPMAGTVVAVKAREGQTINATYEIPAVLSLADLSTMTVWTGVAEADIDRVKPGMSATFNTLGHNGRRWSGQVRQVLPMAPLPPGQEDKKDAAPAKEGVVEYTALFDVSNADTALLPRMTAQVSILTDSARGVLTIPLAGIEEEPEKPGEGTARVLEPDGQAKPRVLKLGKRDRHSVEILDGLREGESIIIGERPAEETRRFVW
jgi:macrolide-specific efflux system membrane fusion protein